MNRWKRVVSGLLAVATVVAGMGVTTAATPAPASGSAGQGLEISPPVIEIAADPGQTVTANIQVRNVTKGELIAKGKADDFGAGSDEDGQPKLLLDETGETRYSLKHWVQGVPDLRLAPQELKTNTIKIAVPANAEPGGHFGVVRFTAVPPELEGTGVALSASVGALVLLKVSGQVTEKMSLAEFSTYSTKDEIITAGKPETKQELDKPRGFFEYGPVGFLVRLRNEGTVHEKAKGTIKVKSWTGKEVASLAVNEKGGNVLPDSVRRFEQILKEKKLFGRYEAALDLTYANDQKLTAKKVFWVLPWKLLLLGLVGLVVLVIVLRLAIRRYNEHIIAKARGRR